MTALDDVKKWMWFIGWTDGGAPGAVKHDADGTVVARAGDITWVTDIEECCAKSERAMIVAEIERRATIPRNAVCQLTSAGGAWIATTATTKTLGKLGDDAPSPATLIPEGVNRGHS